jgi:hypothetical protein
LNLPARISLEEQREKDTSVVQQELDVLTYPETYDESADEAKKTKAGANSLGCAGRLIGYWEPNWAIFSLGKEATIKGVQTGPG